MGNFSGSEDCLNLNIHVPHGVIESGKKVPVLFYIPGGAWFFEDPHIVDGRNFTRS